MVKGLFYVLSNLSGVQLTEKLQQTENEYMRRVAELEKHLDQNRKELNAVKVWGFCQPKIDVATPPFDFLEILLGCVYGKGLWEI